TTMNFQHKSLLFTLALAFAALQIASAQKPLPTESVDIVKDFDARLLESNKVIVNPTLPLLDTTTKKQNYIIPARPLTVSYEAPKLRPVGLKTVKEAPPYNGYVKVGGGVPAAVYGEAGYYFRSGDKFDGKAWFKHHSQSADRNLENQKFFNNDALISGNIYLPKNLALETKVGYQYDRVHYYGYNHADTSFSAERTRQDFRIADLGARLYNSERTTGDINFSIAPNLYVLHDNFSNRETGLNVALTASKWFAEKHPLRLTIRTDITNFDDTVKQALNNIYLQPSFTYHADFIKVKVGGNFASNRDVFSVFPDLEVTLRVFGDGIQLFGGISGDLRKNTYRSMSEYNPFVSIRGTKLKNTRFDNYFGGVKGDLGWLTYSGQASYSKAADLVLYQTLFTPAGITKFRPVYDTARITNIQGTIKLVPIPALTLSGTLSQNLTFDLDREVRPWGLPSTEGDFSALYSILAGKANLRASVHIADGIWFRDQENRAVQGNVLADLSAGGSYYFTDNIGAFLEVNNLLNNRRNRWYQYPTFGTNFLAGITARF
ncbi:MAG: hypothetical protein ABIO24_06605, partial [Saprospiraceae bacterium]